MDRSVREEITEFVSTKPESLDVIGYGSCVKNQIVKGSQIDVILAVNNSKEWHKKNYSLNKSDYCKRGYFFLRSNLSDCVTKINYISYLKYHNKMFKLGVINRDDMLDDLNNWRHGVISGRFQKPIEIIQSDDELDIAIKRNRLNALRASLLLLADKEATEEDLYKTICSLSYIGDIRVKAHFENPNKIDNIVSGSFAEFQSIYRVLNDDYFSLNPNLEVNKDKLFHEIGDMPITLVDYLAENWQNIDNLSGDELRELQSLIYSYFDKLNFKSSIAQPLKGIMSNDILKTVNYAIEKKQKSRL